MAGKESYGGKERKKRSIPFHAFMLCMFDIVCVCTCITSPLWVVDMVMDKDMLHSCH